MSGESHRGLFGPDSQFWKINREQVVLLAGPAAAVLQVAHPVVALGVARHSRFKEDAGGRLRRTLDAVYSVAFGDAETVEQVRKTVGSLHAKVRGEGYSAFDPEAQLWVAATLVMGSVSLFERFVAPLTDGDKDAFLLENRRFIEVFGMPGNLLPGKWQDFQCYWDAMISRDLLGSHPICGEVARAVLQPTRPWAFRLVHPALPALASVLIPEALAKKLELPTGWNPQTLWVLLDRFLPAIIHGLPSAIRFSRHYRRANFASLMGNSQHDRRGPND